MADVPAWIRANNKKAGNSLQGPSSMNAKITGNGISSMNSKIARPTVQNYADGGMATKDITSPTDGWAAHGSRNYKKADGGMIKHLADGTASDGEWARDENYGDGTTGDERVAMMRDPSLPAKETAPTNEPKQKMDMGEFEGLDDAIARNKADTPSAPAKMSFKEAFRNAKDGSTFEWEGKQYKKEYAQPKAAPKAEPKVEPKAPVASAPKSEPPKADTDQKKTEFVNPRPNKQPGIYTGSQKEWGQYRMRQRAERNQANESSAEVERLIRQNEEASKKKPSGRGRIDTSNIDSKTLLPRR